jgi:hypothetical protein
VLQTPYLSIGPRTTLQGCRGAGGQGRALFGSSAPWLLYTEAGVSSGTAGLHLGVIAAGVGEDDPVITTPSSFVASANSIWTCPEGCAILETLMEIET